MGHGYRNVPTWLDVDLHERTRSGIRPLQRQHVHGSYRQDLLALALAILTGVGVAFMLVGFVATVAAIF